MIVRTTLAKLREESEKRLDELGTEQRSSERELKKSHARVRKLVSVSSASASDGVAVTDQLADLQDRIRVLEQRTIAIREEVLSLKQEAVDEVDLTQALSAFDPVWESLSPREQSRLIRLLIERVGYDGRDGKVTVTFRSLGIKALCTEADLRDREDIA